MKNDFVRICCLVVIAAFLLGGTAHAADQSGKEVLAQVGSKTITAADVDRLISFYPENQQAMIKSSPEGREAVLKNLVTIMAVADVARKKGYLKKKEIAQQLRLVQDEFLTKIYMEKEIISKVKITDQEAQQYYKNNLALFVRPEQIRARHILIAVKQGASEEDKKIARKKADDILDRIKKGDDFAKLASEYSDDIGSRPKGGDLGFFPKNVMIPEFEKAAFALEPGGLSNVVETSFGYHIIKVEEKKKAETPPYESIKEEVKSRALQTAQQEKVNSFIESSLKASGVKLYTGKAEKK